MFKELSDYCPACESQKVSPWLNKEKFGINYGIWKCYHCKTGFMNPQPSRTFLDSIYQYSGHGLSRPISFSEVINNELEYPNATIDSKRLVTWSKKYLSSNKLQCALDIGSGFGFFSRAALQEGFKVKAVNPGIWENNIFKELNKASPIQTFFENVDFKEESFDLVILSQVLEHVERPFEFLVKIKKVLKLSGVLTIAVPNVNSFLVKILKNKENGCFWVPEHLTYFSEKGLKIILLRAGFVILRNIFISRIPYNTISNRLQIIGKTRIFFNFLTRKIQWLPMKIFDLMKIGIMHNVWAKPYLLN
jgi:2-polyprenyl-3-methyl-5-hydroxy-6-metoxy-1,4-benzoquinol methylase